MTKQINPANTLKFLICLTAIVYIAGCKKPDTTAASIVGTWTPATETQVTKQNGVQTKDSSFTLTPAIIGFSSIAFASSGQAIVSLYPSGLDTTTYTYASGFLNISLGGPSSPTPATLTATTLTVTSLDTTSTSPLIIQTNTLVFNRQ